MEGFYNQVVQLRLMELVLQINCFVDYTIIKISITLFLHHLSIKSQVNIFYNIVHSLPYLNYFLFLFLLSHFFPYLQISTCSSFFQSLFHFLLQNLVILSLFHSNLLPKLCSLSLAISQKSTSSMKELSSSLDYVSLVMKRMKILRKHLERGNSMIMDERGE